MSSLNFTDYHRSLQQNHVKQKKMFENMIDTTYPQKEKDVWNPELTSIIGNNAVYIDPKFV